MTTVEPQAYELIEDGPRVYAVDGKGQEICGAYQPVGHDYWTLYLTRLVMDATGLQTPPHREHFWGDVGRDASRAWVRVIAALYTAAA